ARAAPDIQDVDLVACVEDRCDAVEDLDRGGIDDGPPEAGIARGHAVIAGAGLRLALDDVGHARTVGPEPPASGGAALVAASNARSCAQNATAAGERA